MYIRNLTALVKGGERSREARSLCLHALEAALQAADPKRMIRNHVRLTGERLTVLDQAFNLSEFSRIIVVGAGKASGALAEELHRILGSRISGGIVIVPRSPRVHSRIGPIEILGATHPIPSGMGMRAVSRMLRLAEGVSERDLVICLISGGGSALMPQPWEGVSLADKQRIIKALLKAGANIDELNAVRKHLSAVKGGRLAEKLFPATILSLIVSDVVGDSLGTIASGPTAPDETTYADAIEVMKRFSVWSNAPKSIKRVLQCGERGLVQETSKPHDPIFGNVHNVIIGNTRIAVEAARGALKSRGVDAKVLTCLLQGEASQAGVFLASLPREVREADPHPEKPIAMVWGGETTVTVRGCGKGGRNHELVLAAARGIRNYSGVAIASMGTDGVDGPTDAAGAIADSETVGRALDLGMDADMYLRNNDSHSFFSKLKDLIITGPTATNVNDIAVLVVT
ncbi:MAG: glycerate kinase [Candidatus Bathyarchaeia archaeon]